MKAEHFGLALSRYGDSSQNWSKVMSADASMTPFEYAGGSIVPQTGIYLLEHSCSRIAQKMIAVQGRRFIMCPECIDGGRYLLQRAVPLMTEDPDLSNG
jgi:hypothetical protein